MEVLKYGTRFCPKCGVDWRAEEIPKENRKYYGNETHFSRLVGIEYPEVYDGVLFWKCPDCGEMWKRFSHEHNCS